MAQNAPQGAVVGADGKPAYRPASNGDEGPLRYGGAADFEPTLHRTRPLTDPSDSRPTPAGFQNRMVSYEVATGVETTHAPSGIKLPDAMSISGSSHRGVQEPNRRAWNTAPSQVSSGAFPWSANARVFFIQGGVQLMGSATLIDPRIAITAGSCVHEGRLGTWSTNVQVSPAWDGDDDNFGSAVASSMSTFTGWTNNSTLGDNMGFVRFDRPMGVLTGWFGYGFDNNDAFFTSTFGNMAGYPNAGFAGAPDALYYMFGLADTVAVGQVSATVNWGMRVEGMTGAGMYIIASGARTIYGNYSSETPRTSTATWTRMTQPKFDFLENSFLGPTYGAARDIVPLDVTSVNVTARVGGELQLLNFDAFNNSTADPGSETYTGDIYISTNDNISVFDTLIGTFSFTHDFDPKTSLQVDLPSVVIPENLAAGTYWVGIVHTTTPDANTGNDDTDGFDAHEITVLPYLNLPTGTLDASSPSGAILDFDALAGTVPNYIALSALTDDTRLDDPEAFCNIGNNAACLDPWSGNFNLEMGLLPGTVITHNVENAMVIQVRGSGPMTLDFMGVNYGEEPDAEDGVFISDNGSDWIQILGPWNTRVSATSRWISVTGVDLSNTTINTNGDFYLAFRQRDNFPFGGLDGISIDDVRIHSTFFPTLTVSNLYGGQTTEVKVSSGTPNSLATIVLSVTGPGPTLSIIGDLAVASDFIVLATAALDGAGEFAHPVPLLPAFTGLRVWLDGVDWGSLSSTTDLDVIVR